MFILALQRPTPIIKCSIQTQQSLKSDLLNIIKPTKRGLLNSQAQISQILKDIEELSTSQNAASPEQINGCWKLLWTTEKETLFILKNAGFFGTEAGDSFQIIDVEKEKLQNVITFPPDGGCFKVDSSLKMEDNSRVSFKFQSAELKVGNLNIPFPPFGQGWFDTLYVDDDLRISKDIRNDYLVTVLDGPPQFF
eukprot:TRINITY_DN7138_c0_g2_i1.p3 TRINITY_DN7138_c0_g2~~TRINITY_DN7138_c0_g2_i1.p3  ORF type:complete len:194 (+),score=29.76 TRINITY_DN7138_c0_g2_i1:79-660(+)